MAHLPAEKLNELKIFVEFVKTHPQELHKPELKFFKDYLESLHAHIPELQHEQPKHEEPKHEEPKHEEPKTVPKQETHEHTHEHHEHEHEHEHEHHEHEHTHEHHEHEHHTHSHEIPKEEEKEEEEKEEALPADPEVLPEDIDPPQQFGDLNKDVTDQEQDEAQEAKVKAVEAQTEGNFEEALKHFT